MLAINTNQLLSEVDSLPLDLKTKLIDKLLSSLNPTNDSVEKLWGKEIEARVDAIEHNNVVLIDGNTVFQKIKDKFQ